MDVIAMLNPTSPMQMQQGEIINDITSKMWVERYDTAGEFRFEAPVDAQLRVKMPIGSFVSHLDTPELMIVENHEVHAEKGEEATIVITGRTLESYFEQRIMGSNRTYPRLADTGKFLVPSNKTWDQVVHILNQHLHEAFLLNDDNSIGFINIDSDIPGTTPGEVVSRQIELIDLYSVVLELLKIDNIGIRVFRPGYWSPLGIDSPNTLILVHRGVDRRETFTYSYDDSQIVSADYLWTNKNFKTAALVLGKWVHNIVYLTGYDRYERRMMVVNAPEIDEDYDEGTAAFIESIIADRLAVKGRQALRSQKEINLQKVEIDKKSVEARYRQDFYVGDIIRVIGDYNEAAPMRITEFVEIEDENGTAAYPTLGLPTDQE